RASTRNTQTRVLSCSLPPSVMNVSKRARGGELFDRVAEAIEAIERYPEVWPMFPGWRRQPPIRTKATNRFGCRVVSFLRDGEPVILAYAHERQLRVLDAPIRRHERPLLDPVRVGNSCPATCRTPPAHEPH